MWLSTHVATFLRSPPICFIFILGRLWNCQYVFFCSRWFVVKLGSDSPAGLCNRTSFPSETHLNLNFVSVPHRWFLPWKLSLFLRVCSSGMSKQRVLHFRRQSLISSLATCDALQRHPFRSDLSRFVIAGLT